MTAACWLSLRRWAFIAGSLIVGISEVHAAAAMYVPSGDDVIVETLPAQRDPAIRELRGLRAVLQSRPDDAEAASRYARRAIEIGRVQGDPRFSGYAASALARWSEPATAPVEIAWLQAVLQQQRHDFSGALAALDAVLQREDYAPARLTRAALLSVLGRPEESLRDCAALGRRSLVTATICAAHAGSLSGRAESSLQAIRAVIPQLGGSIDEQLWALSIEAEIAARMERPDAAASFERALGVMDQTGVRDPYLLAAYADFALDQQQAERVLERLQGAERVDSLLLRLALAEQRLGLGSLASHRRELQARFDAVRARAEVTHGREETLFVLRLQRQPDRALKLAQANWASQREPIDARLLLEAAEAAGNAVAARPVLAWMQQTQIEDPLLHRLVRQLGLVK